MSTEGRAPLGWLPISGEHRWGEPISQEDQASLEARLQQWQAEADHGDRCSPWEGMRLTGAHVYWLAVRAMAGAGGDAGATAAAEAQLRVVSGGGRNWGGDESWGGAVLGVQTRRELLELRQKAGAYWDVVTDLTAMHLEGANLIGAHLEGAFLHRAHLEGAFLSNAHLEDAVLTMTHLQQAQLWAAHLEGTSLILANLEGAMMTTAELDHNTVLWGARLSGAWLGAAQMQDVNLAVVDWSQVSVLGDEVYARQPQNLVGQPKKPMEWLEDYQAAVLAYRSLAAVLAAQGASEVAATFAYRAQRLQRQVLWRQRHYGQWLFSAFLDGLAGYGYRPGRSLGIYVVAICGFALGYWFLGPTAGQHFAPDGALIFSVTSFHGRGFFPGGLDLENWITRLAALEAMVGLVIEISFIATFTQRFFGVK
jgi:hypothetical protein